MLKIFIILGEAAIFFYSSTSLPHRSITAFYWILQLKWVERTVIICVYSTSISVFGNDCGSYLWIYFPIHSHLSRHFSSDASHTFRLCSNKLPRSLPQLKTLWNNTQHSFKSFSNSMHWFPSVWRKVYIWRCQEILNNFSLFCIWSSTLCKSCHPGKIESLPWQKKKLILKF